MLALGEARVECALGSAPTAMIVRPEIEQYAEAHTTPHEPLLEELAAETRATLPDPEMLSGPVLGRLLELLVFASGARRVLEIGTYSGYSTLSMARGLPPDGRIDTCELEERRAEVARRYIARSPYRDRIRVHVGPAQETLARLEGPFDFVFIDADKTGYDAYYEAVLPKLAPRGLIVFDNTLQSGRVVDAPEEGEGTRAIVALNRKLRDDPRVACVLLTVRDGVTVVRRR
jgi:caffeoyl-CoA O-methyltransferase